MNVKHARLIRQAQRTYILKIEEATPGNMVPDYKNIVQASHTLAGLARRVWPSLNSLGRGYAGRLLKLATMRETSFNLSDACARLARV